MPAGIIATIDGGYATIDFVDQSKRGPALAAVMADAGPGVIQTITRDGPRRKYRMPEGNALAAGLIDGTEDGAVFSAGADTGAAAALQDADPNVNPGSDNANWHTPVAEHTSANKYVGQVPNATVLHNRHQVHTGDATSYGGEPVATPHRELIDYVKGYEQDNPRGSVPGPTHVRPAAEANLALGDQPSALGSDPGGIPDGAPHPLDADNGADTQLPEATPRTTSAPTQKWPSGEPSDDWKRAELDAYALSELNLDTTGLANKGEVLDAIQNGK